MVREHGDELDAEALTNIAGLLLTAGHETTANMLGIGTLALLQHPDQLEWLRANPDQIGSAVEELLQFLSVAHSGIPRATKQEVRLGDQTIPAGSQVQFGLAAANRDPRFFDDPDRLDLTRNPTAHVAFGHGPHHCLGAPLARMEMAAAFSTLLKRFPTLALGVPFEGVELRPHRVVYGLAALPVTW
ncbi:cytochrome P450 [Saccharopolyspora tripterygii]